MSSSSLPPPSSFDIIPALHSLLSRLSSSLENSSYVPPLSLKDVAAEAASVKIRIQKARALVDTLPDIDRTVEEQEGDLEELKTMIGKQKRTLRRALSHGDRDL